MSPDLIIDNVSEEEYEVSGSKFITFPAGAKKGDTQYRTIECTELDWDTPGKSMKIMVTVTEDGPDKSKAEKISFGTDVKSIWKGKDLYKAITGHDIPMKAGSDGRKHPAPNPMEITGKIAVGVWQMQEGKKGGVGETVLYPKLQNIIAVKDRPSATATVGI